MSDMSFGIPSFNRTKWFDNYFISFSLNSRRFNTSDNIFSSEIDDNSELLDNFAPKLTPAEEDKNSNLDNKEITEISKGKNENIDDKKIDEYGKDKPKIDGLILKNGLYCTQDGAPATGKFDIFTECNMALFNSMSVDKGTKFYIKNGKLYNGKLGSIEYKNGLPVGYGTANGKQSFKYIFDENGNLQEFTSESNNNRSTSALKFQFTRDNQGNLTKAVALGNGDFVNETVEIQRDSSGKPIQEVHSGISNYSIEYKYDNKNNLLEKNKNDEKLRYEYDDKGNITKETKTTQMGEKSYTETTYYDYEYDNEGNILQTTQKTFDNCGHQRNFKIVKGDETIANYLVKTADQMLDGKNNYIYISTLIRPIAIKWKEGITSYCFNSDGTITVKEGNKEIKYDAKGFEIKT